MFIPQARQTATGANPVKSPSVAGARICTATSSAPPLLAAAPTDRTVEEWEHEPPTLEFSIAPAFPPIVGLRAPTLEQLASLSALPVSQHGRGAKKKSKFMSKVFNPQASRPQRTLTTPMNTVTVTITETFTAFTTSTSLPSYWSSVFALSQFAGISPYTSLFDEYRFDQIEVWLEPSIIMSPSAGSAMLYSAVDLDDANTPASGDDVALRQGVAISETGTGHYHKWKPFVATALYSGTFTSYGSIPAPWIDCASPSVQHFGLKVASPNADGIARLYRAEVRILVSFRGPAI